jgi:hypothetical protein
VSADVAYSYIGSHHVQRFNILKREPKQSCTA